MSSAYPRYNAQLAIANSELATADILKKNASLLEAWTRSVTINNDPVTQTIKDTDGGPLQGEAATAASRFGLDDVGKDLDQMLGAVGTGNDGLLGAMKNLAGLIEAVQYFVANVPHEVGVQDMTQFGAYGSYAMTDFDLTDRLWEAKAKDYLGRLNDAYPEFLAPMINFQQVKWTSRRAL